MDRIDHRIQGSKKKYTYLGGYVKDPKGGRYKDAVSYDVVSMYPTMAAIHHISSETVNCDCCRDDKEGRVPKEVMNLINEHLRKNGNQNRPWHYWICRKKPGIFSKVMQSLIERKIRYKRSGEKLKEKAVKIVMNSGYGCFGSLYYRYRDPRVAELITAFGQYTLKQLFESVDGEDEVLYGDTDSFYLPSKKDAIIEKASKLGVRLEVDRRWKILFLTSNKKQYFGLTEEGDLIHKTLTGMKNNQPSFFDKVTRRLICKEFIESFVTNIGNPLEEILSYVRSAFEQLEICNIDELHYSQRAEKNLYDYKNNGIQRQIYNEILKDCGGSEELAQSRSQEGNVYEYWKVIVNGIETVTIHQEKYPLNMVKYREELFTCIQPILQVYGVNKDEMNQLRNEMGASGPITVARKKRLSND